MNKRGTWGAVALLTALLPGTAWGYAYLCDSVDAHGNRVGDNCATCDNSNAPRWANRQLNWYVKRAAPNYLGTETWMAAAQTAFDAWNTVSCKEFAVQDLGDVANPDFGSNQAQQTLFWATDQATIQALVGADWQALLGLTLPRYYTAGDCSSRDFFDADMLMNGAAGFAWTVDMANCQGEGCISVVSTLIHEVGHAFGLGHPCVSDDCPAGGAIMAAVAYPRMDIWQPLPDDMAGFCALYPGTVGGLGSACTGNEACSTGLCLDDNGVHYCSQACSNSCPAGWDCLNGTCRRNVPNVGGECAGACAAGSLCLQDSSTSYHCYKTCTPLNTPSGCGNGERCYDISSDHSTGACVTEGSQQPGEHCGGHFGQCRVGANCYALSDFASGAECRTDTGCSADQICYDNGSIQRCLETVCLQDCTSNAQCPSGQRCDLSGGSPGVCLGARREGAACGDGTIESECDVGLLCMCEDVGRECACRRDCTNSSGACLPGWRCSPVDNTTARVCLAIRTEGQGCNSAVCDNGLLCIVDAPNQGSHCYRDCSQLPCAPGKECHVYGQGTTQQFSICEEPTPVTSSSSGTSGGSSTSGSSTSHSGSTTSSSGGGSSGNPGGKPWGELCEFNSDCQSGICISTASLGRICVSTCDPRLGHYDCNHKDNVSEGCTASDPNNLAAGGLCLPGAGTGTKDPGATCSEPKQCKSGICQDRTCLIWCTDDGKCGNLDQQGWTCDRSTVSPGVCKPGSGGSNPGAGSTSTCACSSSGAGGTVGLWLVLLGLLAGRRQSFFKASKRS